MILLILFYNLVSLYRVLDHRHGSKRNRVVTYNKINISNEDLKKFLRNELNDVLPLISDQLDDKFRNRNVDLNSYRDIIMVSKRVQNRGGKRMVEYTINEKIVPRTNISEGPVKKDGNHLAVVLCISIMFLAGVGYILFIKMVKSSKLLDFMRGKK